MSPYTGLITVKLTLTKHLIRNVTFYTSSTKTRNIHTFHFETKNICILAVINFDLRLDKLFFLAVVTIATGSPAAPARDHWRREKLNMLSTLFVVPHLLNIYFSVLPERPANTTADVRLTLHSLK